MTSDGCSLPRMTMSADSKIKNYQNIVDASSKSYKSTSSASKRKSDSCSSVNNEDRKRRKISKCKEEEVTKRHSLNNESKNKGSSVIGKSYNDKVKSSDRHSSSSQEDSFSKSKPFDLSDKSKKNYKHSNSQPEKRSKEEKRRNDEHRSKDSKSKSSSSRSSKFKDNDKNKDKYKGQEHEEYNKSKVGEESKESKKRKMVKKSTSEEDDGIDCSSGTSFAEALGMCTTSTGRKKKVSKSSSLLEKTNFPKLSESCTGRGLTSPPFPMKAKCEISDSPPLLPSSATLQPLSKYDEEVVDLALTLPAMITNSKPLPKLNSVQRRHNEDNMLAKAIYAKNQRTKIYSGNKTGSKTVPSLSEMCIRVLFENIDALEYTGGVPYYIIKPALERATPEQIFKLEHRNPYLLEESDELWKFHCNKNFRTKQRGEIESWREMYMRCVDEREAKLAALTANIKQSIGKSQPQRLTKLAYVDNVVKPPRDVIRKQVKYGTDTAQIENFNLKKRTIADTIGGSSSNSSNNKSSRSKVSQEPMKIAGPPPPMARISFSATKTIKKEKAPLMAKLLRAVKGRYKR